MAESIHLWLPDADATDRFGRALGAALVAGDVLALTGDLGAGKTGVARAELQPAQRLEAEPVGREDDRRACGADDRWQRAAVAGREGHAGRVVVCGRAGVQFR